MAKPATPAVTHHAMSQRLLDLHAETLLPEPYPITDTIIVTPPGRTRRRAMYEADLRLFMTRQMLAQALAAAAEPAPQAPELTPVEPVDDDAETAAAAQLEKTAATLQDVHTAAVSAWMQRTAAVKDRVEAINAQIRECSDDYDRAFFGDVYDAVMEFFEDKPLVWDRFLPDIKAEFLPAAPDDGTCSSCGQVVDEEQAKKALASST